MVAKATERSREQCWCCSLDISIELLSRLLRRPKFRPVFLEKSTLTEDLTTELGESDFLIGRSVWTVQVAVKILTKVLQTDLVASVKFHLLLVAKLR